MFDNWSMDNMFKSALPGYNQAQGLAQQATNTAQARDKSSVFNPDQMKGFDTSGLAAAMRQQTAKGGAMARNRAAGALQKAGIQGADQGRAITDVAGQEAASNQANESALAWQDYMQKYNQWQFQEQMKQHTMDREQEQYKSDQERQDKNNPFNFIGNVGGQALGLWGGNKLAGLGK